MYVIKLIIPLFLLFSIPVFQPVEVLAREPMRHNYVGVDMCKLCHKQKELGNQYDKWTSTAHSKAFYVLESPAAREIAASLGIDNPQQSGKCLRCHASCYGFTEECVSKDLRVEDGVQCESCHGPGEEYMYLEVMEDLKEAVAAGLVMPTEDTCRKCHNPESPTYNPERDPTPDGKAVDFYYPNTQEDDRTSQSCKKE